MLPNHQIQRYLRRVEKTLMEKATRKKLELSSHWVNQCPGKPGVYVAFEHGGLVYVGETGNLRGRMRDLLDSRRHSLRRNIGKYNFSGEKGYRDATVREKFPEHIEKKVVHWLEKDIKISLLTTKLGRKEIEERLVNKYEPKYNKRARRKTP